MFSKYPSKIETLIESESILYTFPVLIGDTREKLINNKLYVIHANLSIKACLVFDLEGNMIDSYSTCIGDVFYKGRLFSDWIINNYKMEINYVI